MLQTRHHERICADEAWWVGDRKGIRVGAVERALAFIVETPMALATWQHRKPINIKFTFIAAVFLLSNSPHTPHSCWFRVKQEQSHDKSSLFSRVKPCPESRLNFSTGLSWLNGSKIWETSLHLDSLISLIDVAKLNEALGISSPSLYNVNLPAASQLL